MENPDPVAYCGPQPDPQFVEGQIIFTEEDFSTLRCLMNEMIRFMGQSEAIIRYYEQNN